MRAHFVIPAKAGIWARRAVSSGPEIPAYAGMTSKGAGMTKMGDGLWGPS